MGWDAGLGERLVSGGGAVARCQYSYEFERAGYHAKSGRFGIWASEFELPWEWRRKEREK
jgi:endonuclease YncB( thermonuclease family)